MNTVSSKTSAIIAMLISLISFGLTIASFVAAFTVPPIEHEMSRSFALWIYSMIVAFFSLIFYFIDAIFSSIKVFMKIHPLFNAILSMLLFGAIPMALFTGGLIIWNAYYLAIFILEIVSIVKHAKLQTQEK